MQEKVEQILTKRRQRLGNISTSFTTQTEQQNQMRPMEQVKQGTFLPQNASLLTKIKAMQQNIEKVEQQINVSQQPEEQVNAVSAVEYQPLVQQQINLFPKFDYEIEQKDLVLINNNNYNQPDRIQQKQKLPSRKQQQLQQLNKLKKQQLFYELQSTQIQANQLEYPDIDLSKEENSELDQCQVLSQQLLKTNTDNFQEVQESTKSLLQDANTILIDNQLTNSQNSNEQKLKLKQSQIKQKISDLQNELKETRFDGVKNINIQEEALFLQKENQRLIGQDDFSEKNVFLSRLQKNNSQIDQNQIGNSSSNFQQKLDQTFSINQAQKPPSGQLFTKSLIERENAQKQLFPKLLSSNQSNSQIKNQIIKVGEASDFLINLSQQMKSQLQFKNNVFLNSQLNLGQQYFDIQDNSKGGDEFSKHLEQQQQLQQMKLDDFVSECQRQSNKQSQLVKVLTNNLRPDDSDRKYNASDNLQEEELNNDAKLSLLLQAKKQLKTTQNKQQKAVQRTKQEIIQQNVMQINQQNGAKNNTILQQDRDDIAAASDLLNEEVNQIVNQINSNQNNYLLFNVNNDVKSASQILADGDGPQQQENQVINEDVQHNIKLQNKIYQNVYLPQKINQQLQQNEYVLQQLETHTTQQMKDKLLKDMDNNEIEKFIHQQLQDNKLNKAITDQYSEANQTGKSLNVKQSMYQQQFKQNGLLNYENLNQLLK